MVVPAATSLSVVPIANDQRNRSTCRQCMKCIIQPSSYHSSNSLASNQHNSSSIYLKPLKTVTSLALKVKV